MVTVISLVFFLIQLSGDPLDALVPPGATPADRAVLAEKYGLDNSLIAQYRIFVGDAVQGDFGESWRSDKPSFEAVLDRLPVTVGLVGGAFFLATIIALAAGACGRISSGWDRGWFVGGHGDWWSGSPCILAWDDADPPVCRPLRLVATVGR